MKHALILTVLIPALLPAQAEDESSELRKGLTTPRMGIYEIKLPETETPGINYAHLAPPDYELGPGDILRIAFYGGIHAEIDVSLDHQGKVFIPAYTLPFLDPATGEEKIVTPALGTLDALGLTVEEFQLTLNESLSHLFPDAKANVTLSALRTIRVHVLGNVMNPGTYFVNGIARISDCLTQAGSIRYPGTHRKVKLHRASGEVWTVDLYAYVQEGDLSQNPYVQNEDRILVPQASKLVVAEGAVEKPGIYELKEEEKLSALLTMAGGVTPYCDVHRVRISSINEPERDRTVDVYDLVFEGISEEDVELLNGDKVSVPTLPYTVTVVGEVPRGGTFSFEPGNDFYYYLGQAGGITRYSKINWTKVKRWNGETVPYTDDYEIKPGDTFIVPRWELAGLNDILSILAQAATVFFIVWQVSGASN
jgi:protein involved in polysaccharide export with SLBB domain